MSNATVRANAQAMPTDRRGVLRSLLAAGAIAAVPAAAEAALAAPGHPDAALFALFDEARALDAQLQRADAVYDTPSSSAHSGRQCRKP